MFLEEEIGRSDAVKWRSFMPIRFEELWQEYNEKNNITEKLSKLIKCVDVFIEQYESIKNSCEALMHYNSFIKKAINKLNNELLNYPDSVLEVTLIAMQIKLLGLHFKKDKADRKITTYQEKAKYLSNEREASHFYRVITSNSFSSYFFRKPSFSITTIAICNLATWLYWEPYLCINSQEPVDKHSTIITTFFRSMLFLLLESTMIYGYILSNEISTKLENYQNILNRLNYMKMKSNSYDFDISQLNKTLALSNISKHN